MGRVAAACLAVATSACTRWGVVDEHVELRPNMAHLELRRDVIPGVAHVLDDGRISYAVDLDTACATVVRLDRVRDVARRRTLTPAGIVALASGALLVAVTPWLGLPMVLAAGGGALFVGTAVQLPGKHTPADHAAIVERDAVTETHVAACDRGAPPEVGELGLIAPWGELATSRIDDRGVATFVVDWTRARDSAPAGLWHVDADATGAVADFVLSPADQAAARAHIRAPRTP